MGSAPELRATDAVLGSNLGLSGRTSLPATSGVVAIGPLALVPACLGSDCDVHVDLGFEPILWPFATDAAGAFVAAPIPLPNVSFLAGLVFAGQALLPQSGAPWFGLGLRTRSSSRSARDASPTRFRGRLRGCRLGFTPLVPEVLS